MRLRRQFIVPAAALLGLVAAPAVSAAAPSSPGGPGMYVVVLKAGVEPGHVADEHARGIGAEIRSVYRSALRGYAARIPEARLSRLQADPRVAYVEPDATVHATAQTLPWGINRVDADVSSTLAGNGSGAVGTVSAYVIDSGVSAHADLNLVGHVNWTGDGRNYDCSGHGTHVAGTVAARDNASHVVGAAPGVAVTGLKVLGCDGSGSMSNVIAAVDWVTTYAKRPAVVNMSLSGGGSRAVDDAVRNSASRGVLYVLAAGNSGANACNYSPARAGAGTSNGIVTVAAIDSSNREPSWSNYGSCVDIWAPGVSVLSTYNNGGTAYMSGTSMASPHVAGAAGLYLSRNTTVSPAAVEGVLKANVLSPGTVSRDRRAIKVVYQGRY
ncbi:MAG TPA: S8 family peptidase [Acidimicrobiales bacterium]|nr:S8 family peptidase [Acidimicrobiales bacterium]